MHDGDSSGGLNHHEFRGFFNGVCARGDVILEHNAALEIFRTIDADGDEVRGVLELGRRVN